ncbi:FecR family protein [Chitinophaga qingshengii]|uniref:FecR domain-containing protein n=1 Tax=Chitinophaga qingshengii TaxID=1569794 RepID=A0ABR7TFS9_9BACT|nr:FecR domain-containing protein [Chitinophaga qingshengii]MBC9929240.1 FecR domain-containing protein [Chitinophaga qingshengii]
MKKLLKKYVAGKCTPEEQLLIEQWYQQESDNSKADTTGLPFDQLEKTIWRQVQQQTSPSAKRVTMHRYTLLKIAASLLLIAGIGTLMWLRRPVRENWQEVFASSTQQLVLDDGTRVWLNAGGKLRYPAHFTGAERKIELLSGEICLDVKQDPAHPFIVKSGHVNTRVLGTVFNVRNYPQLALLQVTVQQGKVAVQGDQPAGEEVVVLPDEQVTINTGSPAFSKTRVDGTTVNSWTTGKLLFNNERLDIIALLLQNRYNKQISFADSSLGAYRITAGIETADSLSSILDMLCLANKLTYSIHGQHIMLRKQTH